MARSPDARVKLLQDARFLRHFSVLEKGWSATLLEQASSPETDPEVLDIYALDVRRDSSPSFMPPVYKEYGAEIFMALVANPSTKLTTLEGMAYACDLNPHGDYFLQQLEAELERRLDTPEEIKKSKRRRFGRKVLSWYRKNQSSKWHK